MAITSAEYEHRLESLQTRVGQAGLDLFIVSEFDSIYYLTGAGFEPLERPFFLLVRSHGRPVLLVPKLDHEHMKKAHNIAAEDIQTYWEHPAGPNSGWAAQLHELIGDACVVGVEPAIRHEIVQQLQLPSIRIEPLIERLRLLKSEAEIGMIRRAAHYADFGVERLLASAYFGATVAEGFAETRTVTSRIIRETEDWEPLTTKVIMANWAAPGSAMPHSIPNLNDRLCTGPHVALVLTRINGYAAECERTFFTAPPSPEVEKAFGAMMRARDIAFAMIQPGVACAEIDGRLNEFLRHEAYGDAGQRLHRTGHGIGLGNHEAPWVVEGSEDRLAENMVISVEPGIYLHGVGGIRHSDTVLVTKDGCELLTKQPIRLEELLIRNWRPLTRLRGRLVRRALRRPISKQEK